MTSEKLLLVKCTSGMGNRILCALTGILYARLSNRTLIIDWSDENYSTDRTNVFHCFFQSPQCLPTDEIPATESVAPSVWKGHLMESAQEMRTRKGETFDRGIWREFSIDLKKLDYSETVAVLWTYSDKLDLLQNHVENNLPEFSGAGKEDILRSLLRDALCLHPQVRARVDAFKREHFQRSTLGVHVRYSDHRTRLLAALRRVNRLLKQDPEKQIFLSTDNVQVANLFDEMYPRRVIVTPHRYPPVAGGRLHHGRNRPNPTEDGVEALIDLYLLAECDELIVDTSSTFSYVAILLAKPDITIDDVKRRQKLHPRIRGRLWQLLLHTGFFNWGLRLLPKVLRR